MNIIQSTTSTLSTSPVQILGWSASNASRSVKHRLIGGGIAVSIVSPDPDNGVAELLYASAADAYAARDLFREESTFELSSDEVTEVSMTFTVDSVDLALQDDRVHWIVSLAWQEVVNT